MSGGNSKTEPLGTNERLGIASRTKQLATLFQRLGKETTAEKLQAEATRVSQDIFTLFVALSRILDAHEETIAKRWIKKTKLKRSEYLLKAWPAMPRVHRPDVQALKKKFVNQPNDRQYLKTNADDDPSPFMWPYINIEDLIQGDHFLLYLRSRGRNMPSTFAHIDYGSTGMVVELKIVKYLSLKDHIMLLSGDTPQEYGRILRYKADESAEAIVMSSQAFMPGRGLLILYIQRHILGFLLDVIRTSVLHDISVDALICRDVSTLTIELMHICQSHTQQLQQNTLTQTHKQSMVRSMAPDGPYRVPSMLDVQRLSSIVNARVESSLEDLWRLREDPLFFNEWLGNISEHDEGWILDLNKRQCTECGTQDFWDEMLLRLIDESYSRATWWKLIEELLTRFSELKSKYADSIKSCKQLPEDFVKAFNDLWMVLETRSQLIRESLCSAVSGSPQFRSQFIRENISGEDRIMSKPGFSKDPLLVSLMNLGPSSEDERLITVTWPLLLDDIHQQVKDHEQKQRLSAHLQNILNDLSMVCLVISELDLFQPWATSMKLRIQEGCYTEEQFRRNLTTHLNISNLESCKLSGVGNPKKGRFAYSQSERLTKEVLMGKRAAERNLDEFWDQVDDFFKSMTGRTLADTYHPNSWKCRQLERIPEWVDPEPRLKKPSNPSDLSVTLNEVKLDDVNTPDTPRQKKDKIKTRKIATPLTPADEPNGVNPDTPVPPSPQKFRVSRRVYKVFTVLFFTPDINNFPGNLSFQEFAFAMVALGFSAEIITGSIWHFAPGPDLGLNNSVHFHEPHPSRSIPFNIARGWGRQLRNLYGWGIDSFELA